MFGAERVSLGVVVVLWGGAIAVVVTTLSALLASASPFPWWDEWETVAEFGRVMTGSFRLAELWAQHNEHRLLFPRLVFFADYRFFSGMGVFTIATMLALQGVHAIVLCRLARGAGLRGGAWLAVTALIVAGLFSAIQIDNFAWPFQVQIFSVYLAASGAFAAAAAADGARRAGTRVGAAVWLAVAVGLGFVGTFSLANGVFIWPILLLLCLRLGLPWRGVALVAMAAGLSVALYAHGYHQPGSGPRLAGLRDVPWILIFACVYLGNVIGSGGPVVAGLVGAVGALLGAVLSAPGLLLRRPRVPAAEYALGSIVVFVLATAFITGAGRLSMGLDAALASRYATPVLIFWSALMAMLMCRAAESSRPWIHLVCIVMMAYLFLRQGNPTVVGWISAQRTKEMAGLALASEVYDAELLRGVYLDPKKVIDRAAILRTFRLSFFASETHRWLARTLAQPVHSGTRCLGHFDGYTPVATEGGAPGGIVWGWAWDRDARRPVKNIVLCDASRRVVGLASGALERNDVQAVVREVPSRWTGWRGYAQAVDGPLIAYGVLGSEAALCDLGEWRTSADE